MITKIKIAVIAMIGMSFGLNAQNTFPDNGNVGIGMTNPSYSLNVNSSNFVISKFSRTGGGGAAMEIENAAGTGTWRVGVGTNNHFGIYKSNEASFGKQLIIHNNGNIGVGTINPDMKLTVKGNIHAEEVKIDLNVPAPDYVFKEGYILRSIKDVERFIKENNHLPEMPSAKEFEQNGVMQAEMDMNLLKKIEELTLYTIQQQKEIEELKIQNKKLLELQSKLEKLESEK